MSTSPVGSGRSSQRGFTLLELTVVFGLLAGFLVFLTQILSSGVELFDEGETGQELADLGNAAADAVVHSLEGITGPGRERYEPGPPEARLLLQWVPLGLGDPRNAPAAVQALRATVRLDEVEETALLRGALRATAAQSAGSLEPEAVDERLAELVASAPRTGRGDMLLLPWPAEGGDGGFLELRQAVLLPGHRIALDRRREVSLMEVERLDDGTLPREVIEQLTAPIAAGLLHVEIAFASQYTRAFEGQGEGGPEWVWDSARAGLLSADVADPRRRFGLDLWPKSLEDATDDVYPRAARVVLVVADEGPAGLLAKDLAPSDVAMTLLGTDRLPDLEQTPFLKVGAEWVRHGGASGSVLNGLRRGERGTAPRAHPQGTAVRAGKTVVLEVELLAGRDNWNG